MSFRLLLPLSLFFVSADIFSQVPDTARKGIHQVESEYYNSIMKGIPVEEEEGTAFPSDLMMRETGKLPRMVLGWHPYWASSTAHQYYDYNVLSHIAYFSYEVDTATGGYTTIHSWNSTPIIDYAHLRNTKVLLTVTNFGSSRNTELLTDTVKQKLLINTLISLLKARNGDGVNFDLESVSSAQKLNLISFIQRAVSMIKAELPAAEISMATPAVDWSGSWDFKKLSELCDYLIVMGYDYYWSGSSTAGPVAPLEGENYNVTRTVTTYLDAGVAPEKLALGIPWYGYDWPVMGEGRKSTATGNATARVYSAAQQLAETYSKIFDMSTSVPRVSYFASSAWRQMWFEDTLSLFLKYQLVNSRNLAGMGIWALSYEGSYDEVWSTIDHAFSPSEPSSGTGIIKVYPNPATSGTKIEFSVSTGGKISLKIYDLTGREKLVLVDEVREAGLYSENLDPRYLRQGVYLCVLKSGKITSTSKIVIINR